MGVGRADDEACQGVRKTITRLEGILGAITFTESGSLPNGVYSVSGHVGTSPHPLGYVLDQVPQS